MIKKTAEKLIIVFLISLLTGCVITRTINYETTIRAPKPSSFPIEIFESNNINRPYKVIGIVTANAGKFHGNRDTIDRLKSLARQMGGDALLDLSFGASAARMISKTQYGYTSGSVRENWAAKVVIWEKQ